MKSMIDDYFGQGPKGNENVTSETNSEVTKIKAITEEAAGEGISDGKENVKVKETMLNGKSINGKPKSSTKKASPKVKRVAKKRSLSTKKPSHTEEPEIVAATSNKDKTVEDGSTASNFSLRIRMKAKEEDTDNFIDDFSSPEHTEAKPKELKSPQGSMFKYLVSPKNSQLVEKSSVPVTKPRAIADFFSPANSPNTKSAAVPVEKNAPDQSKVVKAEKPPSGEPLDKKATNKKVVRKTKSAKTSKADSVPSSKKSNASDETEVEKASGLQNVKPAAKPKPIKKSLSLTKNETKAVEPHVCPKVGSLSDSNDPGLTVAKTLNSAFQAIMSKSSLNKADPPQTVPDMFSKKRKRENDDDIDADKPCKTVKEDSPVKSTKKRYSNQIESDSDDDVPSTTDTKPGVDMSDIHQLSKNENHTDTVDALSKSEESKRNSLMSYFSKVTKEEAMAKEEKIELKVQAMVHSPPATPSKKTKRRSVNSLPGGALSLSKKKTNAKAKLKGNVDAIDVMDAEEMDSKTKEPSRSISKKQSTPSSKSARRTPQKSLSLKPAEAATTKTDTLKSAKKSLSRGKGKQEINNKTDPSIDTAKSSKHCTVDDECLAVPLPGSKDEVAIEVPKTPSDSNKSWSMRLRITPVQIPSTQGTLLEDDSDNEEIFLRQDKKRKLSNKKCVSDVPIVKDKEILHEDGSRSPDIIFEKETKQGVKIAPLFTRKADSQARLQFLQSGVPDQVKRALETQRSYEEQETDLFPKESHIQQRDNQEWVWNLSDVELPFKATCTQDKPQITSNFLLSDITGCGDIVEEMNQILSASCKGPEMRPVFGLPTEVMKPILRLIKQGASHFKVVNTFRVLRSKLKEEEFAKAAALSALAETEKPKRKSTNRKSISAKQAQPTFRARCWTEKYKPCTASEIIGNGASIQQLKRWLESWRKASEDFSSKSFSREEVKRKKKKKDAFDDDDDFITSDNSSDVTQHNFPVGVAVLCGPNGSGKTSSVYALAKDLGYKVLEVNASEKRNGKLVLSKLSEATQSHQVQQGPTAEQGFAALFGGSTAKSKKPPVKSTKSVNDLDDDKTKKMSLILFEDVDIVFEEEDEGFLSAISTLVSTSKRPVILTTTDPESSMVHRFINSSSLVLLFSCPSNLITIWLQIVSLLEGVYVSPATVKDLVSLCKGDFRRAILQMQLWVSSGGNNLPMPPLTFIANRRKTKKGSKGSVTEENDDLSDMEGESNSHDCTPTIPVNTDCIAPMLGKNDAYENSQDIAFSMRVPFPLDAGLFWWNIPPLLSLKQLKHAELPVIKEDTSTPSLGSGLSRMLDDSFIASFCTDDGSSNADSGMNDDSDAPGSQVTSSQASNSQASNSQATSIADPEELQENQDYPLNPSLSNIGPIHYTSACSQEEMMALYYPLMALSFIDVIGHSSQLNVSSNMEPITRFHNPILKDSLSLTKLEVDGPNCVLNSTAQEISHWLAEQSLNKARTILCKEMPCTGLYSSCLPDEDEYKWREAHAETEKVALAAVPLCVSLERRALFMDYMPILRIFCRLERNRSSINTKRRNRFFHYIKSLGAHPNETQLELLCRSMFES